MILYLTVVENNVCMPCDWFQYIKKKLQKNLIKKILNLIWTPPLSLNYFPLLSSRHQPSEYITIQIRPSAKLAHKVKNPITKEKVFRETTIS